MAPVSAYGGLSPSGIPYPTGIHQPTLEDYFRRCQRVFLSILRCLCFDAFFSRHFFTEPMVAPPFLQDLGSEIR